MIDRVGDKPAPGQLKMVQAFINSANPKSGREDFVNPDCLAQWLADYELLPESSLLRDSDLRQAIAVRDALYAVAAAHGTGPSDINAIETLNRAARSAQMSVSFAQDGRARIEPLAPSVDGALGRILAIVVEAMSDGNWDRLKICRSDDCAWAFYDRSKNRSGAWCDITDCGNIAKARTYRARHSHDAV